MSGPPPATIDLSTRQRALLEQLRQRQTAPQRLVRRVLIVLALAANPCLRITARDLGLNRISVRLWRDRWLAAAEALAQAEQDNLSDPQFLGLITEILDNAPRPGGPATFSPEQIVAVACEPPEKSGCSSASVPPGLAWATAAGDTASGGPSPRSAATAGARPAVRQANAPRVTVATRISIGLATAIIASTPSASGAMAAGTAPASRATIEVTSTTTEKPMMPTRAGSTPRPAARLRNGLGGGRESASQTSASRPSESPKRSRSPSPRRSAMLRKRFVNGFEPCVT